MEKLCTTCGKPVNRAGMNRRGNGRCLICETARVMRTFRYTPNPFDVVEYREDEERWAARPAPTLRRR